MLGPDSRLLTALLIAVSVGLLVAAIRFRLLPVKILSPEELAKEKGAIRTPHT